MTSPISFFASPAYPFYPDPAHLRLCKTLTATRCSW